MEGVAAMAIIAQSTITTTLLLLAPPRAPPPVLSENSDFISLGLPSSISDALSTRGISQPTPIQSATVPRALEGESLVLHAETGSGKSLAFLLPALTRLGLAGQSSLPEDDDDFGRVLVVAPTRELAVQLANEASIILPSPGAVQIVAVGAIPEASALLNARVVACTAPELLDLLESEGTDNAGVVDAVLSQVRVLVLDELDTLLPVGSTYGRKAAQKKKAESRKAQAPPAEELVRAVVEVAPAADLQLLAASATVSRPTRLKLARVLRRDPLARWFDKPPEIVRPYEIGERDLSAVPRAVVIPPGVKHFYVRLASSVKLKRLTPKAAAKPRPMRRLTLKQKRVQKAAARKAAARAPKDGEAHPLLVRAKEAIEEVNPKSALLFLCRSSGLTVRRAARELRELGLPALPLHEAIGLEHDAPPELATDVTEAAEAAAAALAEESGQEPLRMTARQRKQQQEAGGRAAAAVADTSAALQQRHHAVSKAFSAQLDSSSGSKDERAPLLVTFEDMARGLHFDAVDAVFIVGMPDSPATYLHLAGRTGRQPVLEGTVVTICPGSSHEVLQGWSTRLGGIDIEQLELSERAVDEASMVEVEEKVAVESPW